MVGTKPTLRPAAACSARQARTAETEVRIGNGAGGSVEVAMAASRSCMFAGLKECPDSKEGCDPSEADAGAE